MSKVLTAVMVYMEVSVISGGGEVLIVSYKIITVWSEVNMSKQ